ncbi:MAG: OsmC family protein [Bacteroidales bacterium]|nr:OsmC family protein [Bacteroidales bacterium]
MNHKIEVDWNSGMSFETVLNGHKLVMDATPEVGGNDLGPRPKILLLASLAGCSGMDVVSMLKKMRVELDGFKMELEGVLTEEHPKIYNKITIVYKFKGENLPLEKIEKAVNLSQERYCGVSAMLREAAEIDYRIEIL